MYEQQLRSLKMGRRSWRGCWLIVRRGGGQGGGGDCWVQGGVAESKDGECGEYEYVRVK